MREKIVTQEVRHSHPPYKEETEQRRADLAPSRPDLCSLCADTAGF